MPKSILIVDDDEDQHVILRVLLSHYGFRTLHARSLGEAGSILARERPDALILDLDVRLDREHGLDLFNSLHLSHPDLPVVVCTSDALAEFRYPAAVAAAAAWLTKPIHTTNILQTIQELTSDAG